MGQKYDFKKINNIEYNLKKDIKKVMSSSTEYNNAKISMNLKKYIEYLNDFTKSDADAKTVYGMIYCSENLSELKGYQEEFSEIDKETSNIALKSFLRVEREYINQQNNKQISLEVFQQFLLDINKILKIEKYLKTVILNLPNEAEAYNVYIKEAKKYTKYLAKENLTTSQIRRVYSEIMNADDVMTLKRLRPKIAYIQGRNKDNQAIQSLLGIVDFGLANLKMQLKNESENKQNIEIESLKEFMETIVAYRKYIGKDN